MYKLVKRAINIKDQGREACRVRHGRGQIEVSTAPMAPMAADHLKNQVTGRRGGTK